MNSLGDNFANDASIQVALDALIWTTKEINSQVQTLSRSQQLTFDTSLRLSDNSNEFFSGFLSKWLISDKVASTFVFDLNGFEFLLDSLDPKSSPQKANDKVQEETKESSLQIGQLNSSLFKEMNNYGDKQVGLPDHSQQAN